MVSQEIAEALCRGEGGLGRILRRRCCPLRVGRELTGRCGEALGGVGERCESGRREAGRGGGRVPIPGKRAERLPLAPEIAAHDVLDVLSFALQKGWESLQLAAKSIIITL
jgi:hypothetical protein